MPFKKKVKSEPSLEQAAIMTRVPTVNELQDLSTTVNEKLDTSHIVQLMPMNKKMQGLYTMSPSESSTRPGRYSMEEDADYMIVMTECKLTRSDLAKRHVTVSENGVTFNLDSSFSKLDYLICKYNVLCTDGEGSQHALFKFVNLEKEVDKKLSVYEKRVEASAMLHNMNDRDKKDFLRLYGRQVNTMTTKEIGLQLYQELERDADKFIKYGAHKELGHLKLIYEFIEAGFFNFSFNTYKYGDFVLGKTIDEVIAWIKSRENQQIVDSLRIQVNR